MFNQSTRRDFLKNTSGLLGLALATSSFREQKKIPPLSFSTLGCPDWTFQTILDFAVKNKYNGIELRGIMRELELPKCPAFNTAGNIKASLQAATDRGLKFVDLGASAELHHANAAVRKRNLDEAKRFIDLAQELNCPFIRVFPNDLPENRDRDTTLDLIITGLLELGEYAKGSQVRVLMESHGKLVHTKDLERVMHAASHPHVGMVWDIVNMWSVTREPPRYVYRQLHKFIYHTHIKDANIVNGTDHYVLLGTGQTPVFEAIDILYEHNYPGFYSFEWEKLWHPEIAAPEIALADFPLAMQKHFQQG